MPPVAELNDDYVAALLLKDAEATKRSSATNSISTLKRKPDAPKPNISFLRNVLRETDSHNAALKAKEEEESQVRLRNLKHATDETKKRRREAGEDDERDARSKKRRSRGERSGRWASALSGLGSDTQSKQRSKTRDNDAGHDGSAGHGRRDRRDDRERSERHSEHGKSRRHRHRREEHRRYSRSRSRSPGRTKAVHQRPPPGRSSRSLSPKQERGSSRRLEKDNSDSDPLEDFLGPQRPPTILPRGRGALRSSGIDSRFQPDYDPSTDVNLDQDYERDDWDMALEALRDRAKWKAQGSERLRAAGFTDEEVQKWEKGGSGEKDVADVRWRKKGEGREWDRGKVIDEDGVRLKAEW